MITMSRFYYEIMHFLEAVFALWLLSVFSDQFHNNVIWWGKTIRLTSFEGSLGYGVTLILIFIDLFFGTRSLLRIRNVSLGLLANFYQAYRFGIMRENFSSIVDSEI